MFRKFARCALLWFVFVSCRLTLVYILLVLFCLPCFCLHTDVKDETINLSDKELHFKGTANEKNYEVNIEFFKPVDSEGSTYKVLPRSVQMLLKKKESEEEFWPRLLSDKLKEKNQVKIDWDRYVDEDDDQEDFDTSNLDGGMGMGGMPGMGGMGGMPGMGGMGGPGGMDMEALMKQSTFFVLPMFV